MLTFAILCGWAFAVHPPLGAGTSCGTAGNNTTFTTSTTSSTDTQTTDETVRVDTFSTHVVATDPTGGTAFDQELALAFADPAVQSAVASARAALLAGPFPSLVIVAGPTLVTSNEQLTGSTVETMETSREETMTVDPTMTIGPACIGIGDRDASNTMACSPCDVPDGCDCAEIPASGTPFCVCAGTTNFNANTDTHAVVHQLRTTTNTFLTTQEYALTASLLDHFVVYKTKISKGTAKVAPFGPLTLADVLGTADYDVKALVALALPADKNMGGVADPTTHLARYALKRRKGPTKFRKVSDVTITNQCGTLTLTAVKPESLLVPVREDSLSLPPVPDPTTSEVDHFLCYKAKAQKKRTNGTPVATFPKGVQVVAADHFQTRRYDLKKVTRLCVPVAKSGTPVVSKTGVPVPITPATVRHAAGHLVCYQAKIAKKAIPQDGCGPVDPKNKGTKITPPPAKHQPQTGVLVNGQLGPATLDTKKELELCIPSTAALP